MYEPEATLLPAPDRPAVGHAAMRAALDGFLALQGRMTMETVYVVESGGLAVTRGRWRLEGGTTPDGQPAALQGESVEVLRRQADGTWLVAIDAPFGAG